MNRPYHLGAPPWGICRYRRAASGYHLSVDGGGRLRFDRNPVRSWTFDPDMLMERQKRPRDAPGGLGGGFGWARAARSWNRKS